jgi:predicted N-acetyltransferase YhbS
MIQTSISPIENREVDEAANLCAEAFIQTPFTITVMGGKGKKEVKNLRRGMKMLLKTPGDCQKSTPKGLATLPGLIFGGKAFRNVIYFRKKWAEHDPKEPHWHLDPLCVLPAKQGQGIGS